MNKNLIVILVWVVAIGVLFGLAWYKGYVVRFRNYWNATLEELWKCTWPTWDELKGSTVLVTITILMLGGFCYAVDRVFFYLVRLIIS